MNAFSLFPYYVPFEKDMVLPVKKLESLLPRMPSFAKFCWNWSCGSGEEDEKVKINDKIRIRNAHLSLEFRWANTPPPKKPHKRKTNKKEQIKCILVKKSNGKLTAESSYEIFCLAINC